MDSRGWGKRETHCLVSVWGDESVQRKLEDSYHNRAIYEDISRALEGNGYRRSWQQCQRKIKHLKSAFRKAKDSNNKSGRDRAGCPFYDELDRVLGGRPSLGPGEGDALDSDVEEPLLRSAMDAAADAAVTSSNATPAETRGEDGDGDDSSLPLSSLRLIVPPLQLVSAALWAIVKQRAVAYYELVEEFVTTVLDMAPGLLTDRETIQLVLGLRSQVVLELCRTDEFASLHTIQPHLNRMNLYITKREKIISDSEAKASVINFFKIVHTLLDSPSHRDVFYQKIFPTVFGPEYDLALQALTKKFLSRLQKLLPVPNLEQTANWLSLSPSILKECVEFTNRPQPLSNLIHHHNHHRNEVPKDVPSACGDSILVSLSYQLQKESADKEGVILKSGSMCAPNDLHRLGSFGSESDTAVSKDVEETNAEPIWDAGGDGDRYTDDSSEDHGASVEVILQSDQNESSEMEEKRFSFSKTGGGPSSKTVKCHICGQAFGSLSKLKRHHISGSDCRRRSGQNQGNLDPNRSANQRSFFKTMRLHPERKNDIETNLSSSEKDPLFLASTATAMTHLNTLPNLEHSCGDDSLICCVCGKAFTNFKCFDKHQKSCLVSVKRKRQTDLKCSANLASNSEQRPKSEEPSPRENETRLSNAQPDSLGDQTCKRSSRVKTCSVCGEVFTSSTDFTEHTKGHIVQSPYPCSYCGKGFDHYEDCERHQGNECRGSNQQSQIGIDFTQGKTFKDVSKNNLESAFSLSSSPQAPSSPDALSNSSKLSFTCEDCGQGFDYLKSFEKHQKRCSQRSDRRKRPKRRVNSNHFVIFACNFQSADHTLEKTNSSETAECETTSLANSADHEMERQSKPLLIKCTMCEKSFSLILDMKKHYSRSHKVSGSYPCPLCKRTFVRLCELVRHQQNKKLYQCSACEKCFTRLSFLNRHEKNHNIDTAPRLCETCGKSFKFLTHLILHQRKHRNQQPCICSYCGKQYSTKDCLKAHMVRHTSGYSCPTCGKKFFRRIYLKWHQYKHTGQNPYLCDTCGKGWPTVAQLKLHMVQHSEERPFKCEDCGVCYKRDSHLVAHRRAKHIGIRPFACEVCSKAFRLNNELKKHMMIHTGEKPYVCPRCGKTFARKSRLREHREKACL